MKCKMASKSAAFSIGNEVSKRVMPCTNFCTLNKKIRYFMIVKVIIFL